MRNYFTFGTIDSRNFGVYISGSGVFNSPEREFNMVDVPGRNGSVILSATRFPNLELTYPAFIYTNFKNNLAALRSAMQSIQTYQKLSDTYNTDEFRMAVYAADFAIAATKPLLAGEFELTFSCKPQRFLTIGETEVAVDDGDEITNPTAFDSLPKITVTGYGTLYIGSQRIVISDVFPSVVIDSELGDCYYGINNANSVVAFADNDFPVLHPGANGITFDETITAVEIVPRWWRI